MICSSMDEMIGLNQHYEKKVRPYIDLVDTLRSLGVENDLNLPAIAVIGDQSSGKSSVLEALSGVALPRGMGIVTRCPLVLKLKRITKGKNWHGLLTYRDQMQELKEPEETEKAVINAQTVLAGTGEGISHEMITLEIQSCDVPDLTLIDLPGIARVPTGTQPKDIDEQIRGLIQKFIKRQETISLVVVPANTDIATTEALKMAYNVDSTGQRTLGILTKPDLVDKGTEEMVVKTVNNEVVQLNKGYMIVRCRGQQDINDRLDLAKALEKERRFFKEHDQFRSLLEEGKATVPILGERLTEELVKHIIENMPQLEKQLEMKLVKMFDELKALGDDVPTDDELKQNNFLILKIRQFNCALEDVKKVEDSLVKSDTRVFSKLRSEFASWKVHLDSKPIICHASKDEESIRIELQDYLKNHRGKELPGFMNYKSFEDIIRSHIDELEEPALKLLKNVSDIIQLCAGRIASCIFKGFPHLLNAAKDKLGEILDEQFRKAQENVRYQFKMEKIVYCQDNLYNYQMSTVRTKPAGFGLQLPNVSADVKEMAFHLISYLMITCDRLANQIPIIIQYHMMDQCISQLQDAMLGLIAKGKNGMLLQEAPAILSKRKDLKERMERLKCASKTLSKFVRSAQS